MEDVTREEIEANTKLAMARAVRELAEAAEQLGFAPMTRDAVLKVIERLVVVKT